jgi:hypothetical protein
MAQQIHRLQGSLRAQLEAKELNRTAGEITDGNWDFWVPQYMERHCKGPCLDFL